MNQKKSKPQRGRPKSPEPDPIECDPISSEEFEEAVKAVLLASLSEDQHSENREPTKEELEQKWKLERR